jgi:hypothetical protein
MFLVILDVGPPTSAKVWRHFSPHIAEPLVVPGGFQDCIPIEEDVLEDISKFGDDFLPEYTLRANRSMQ